METIAHLVLFPVENVQPSGKWLLIGLGGGVLTMKLMRAFPKVRSLNLWTGSISIHFRSI